MGAPHSHHHRGRVRRTRRFAAAAGASMLLAAAAWLAPGAAAAPATAAAAAAPQGETLAAMIAERQRFFGAENVDPRTGALPRDEVHLVWVTVATFAAAIDGHVVLFDAYIHKQEEGKRNYVPATTEDLVALQPEAIFLGHAHYDHGQLTDEIAAATGAKVVGTRGHCEQATTDAGTPLECIVAFEEDAQFGDVAQVDVLPGVCSTAVLHVHSAAEPPDPERDQTNPLLFTPDPGSVLLHPPGPSTTLVGPGAEHGTVLYQLRIGDFTMVMHDSSGPLKEQAPEVLDVFRSLPSTDVQVGALISFNNPTNGLRDPAMYIDAFDPQVFIPNHHDFVAEYGSADDFEPALERELQAYDTNPEIRFLYDPYDYVRPNLLSFEVDAPRWDDAGGTPCPRANVAGTAAGPSGDAGSTGGSVLASARAAAASLPATGLGLGAGVGALALMVAAVAARRAATGRGRS
jgi:hypothetical protein